MDTVESTAGGGTNITGLVAQRLGQQEIELITLRVQLDQAQATITGLRQELADLQNSQVPSGG